MEFEIVIWKWRKAPSYLRELSKHGGDEDYIIFTGEPDIFNAPTDNWMLTSIAEALCGYESLRQGFKYHGHSGFITAHA